MTSFGGRCPVLLSFALLTPEQVATCIDEIGVRLYVAQAHHSAMRFAGPIRQARHSHHECAWPDDESRLGKTPVIGVFSETARKMAEVLKLLGSEHAMVVHSDGLDDFAWMSHSCGRARGAIIEYDIEPAQLDLDPRTAADLAGVVADSAESAWPWKTISHRRHQCCRDIVALNAGAAIYVGGIATPKNGVVMAQDAISSGQARRLAGWYASPH